MKFKTKDLIHELKHHLPFTVFATAIAIIIIISFIYFLKQNISETIFHVLHPLHIIASAIVTTAIFYKYKKNIFQAIIAGIFGALIIGSISDIIFPYLGGKILNLNLSFHLPLIEKPILILSSAIVGSILGTFIKITKIPHTVHVSLSVLASLFYILAFTPKISLLYFTGILIVIIIAVIIPCCTSDILFPFFFLGKRIKTCNCKH